jgi:ribonucleoside-diphosphate reductase alpha chain
MNNIPLARDLALKRTVHAPVDQKPLYAWRDVIAPTEISLPPIVLLCPHGEERFDMTEVADTLGKAFTNVCISQGEKEIFTEKNRAWVAQICRELAGNLGEMARKQNPLRLTLNGLYELIEKTLVDNNAYMVAKSLLLNRSRKLSVSRESAAQSTVRVIRRNSQIVPWNDHKVEIAIRKTFLSLARDSAPAVAIAKAVSERVNATNQAFVRIEEVQDIVQEEIMKAGHFKVAEAYILFRAERAVARENGSDLIETAPEKAVIGQETLVVVKKPNGETVLWEGADLRKRIEFAMTGLELCMTSDEIEFELRRAVYDQISQKDLDSTIILNSKTLIEKDADFAKFAGRIQLTYIYEEVLGWDILRDGIARLKECHQKAFKKYIEHGIAIKRLNPRLLEYDLARLAGALDPSSDLEFDFLGVQTLYDRYLIIDKVSKPSRRIETPQFFWMRVAMGLFLDEKGDRESKAVGLYDLYKTRRFCSSTPTLFNSGTLHSQLSSCFPGDTPIVTSTGLRNIGDIRVGESVLAQDGTFRRVLGTRAKANEKRLVDVSLSAMIGGASWIRPTEDHLLFAISGADIACIRQRASGGQSACVDYRGRRDQCYAIKDHYSAVCERVLEVDFMRNAAWIPAGELQKGDFVEMLFPRVERALDLRPADYLGGIPLVERDGFLHELHQDDKRYAEPTAKRQVKPIRARVALDANFLRLVGYFLSEGHCQGTDSVYFTFGRSEVDYISDTSELCERVFGLTPLLKKGSGEATCVVLHSKLATMFMHALFGTGFDKKKLPQCVMEAPNDALEDLLVGVFRGDGCAVAPTQLSLQLSNRDLILQLFQVALKIGILPIVQKPAMPPLGTVQPYILAVTPSNAPRLAFRVGKGIDLFDFQGEEVKWKNRRFFIDGRAFYRVEAVGYSPFKGDVFDIQVEGDPSFSAAGICAHNCYLYYVDDSIEGIFQRGIAENAYLSKWAGGLGGSWTAVRGTGAYIGGTNGESQGVIPFLKLHNDQLVAVNQCFGPETVVYTAEGPKAIRDIEKGELVLGNSGTYREVTEKFAYDQHGPMVAVKIKHSVTPIRVTSGHPFFAIRGVPLEQTCERTTRWLAKDKVRSEWIDAGELRLGDYVAQTVPTQVIPVEGLSEDDARMYGILLGDGHLSRDGRQWGIFGNPKSDEHIQFVRRYLGDRGIHSWETGRGETYLQIHWESSRSVVREGTTGRATGAGAATMLFGHDDLYDKDGEKRISRRFSHLQHGHTRSLIHGLLETNGGVLRGAEIYFSNTSQPLVEGLRYQLLRLGIPTAGQFRKRNQAQEGGRSDGAATRFTGCCDSYDIRIPAVMEIAALVGCKPLTKRNWITHEGCVYSRVRDVSSIEPDPFVFDLKVEGDETYMTNAALVHNGGKRKGSGCAYLESWHNDIFEFLELRKNTGDDRRRTHDMNTANWIPDLFMKRMEARGTWTLFRANEVPDLHEAFGHKFEELYLNYERLSEEGKVHGHKIDALDLWKKMLSMIFETGHPWITFKDPCNVRSPQDHVGVVHSSNLCSEITLNTSKEETAVCNLGSVILETHLKPDGAIDHRKLRETIRMAVRALDNVIDINFYPTEAAERSNKRHRPIGMGVMGLANTLYMKGVAFASPEAVEFNDEAMEAVAYYAYEASSDLAAERGTYSSYKGSKWDRGLLPPDTVDLLEKERGLPIQVPRGFRMDWTPLRAKIAAQGMRNSNVLAIAPTATISNITNTSPCIEPTYKNLFVKSNLSGEFIVLNPFLVKDLKARGLWDQDMMDNLKYFDGELRDIDRIPADLKQRYLTAFDIDPKWVVDAAARRQKWIDQSQSVNLWIKTPDLKTLSHMYRHAWHAGLKTTYYLRGLGASNIEKATVTVKKEMRGAAGETKAETATRDAAALLSVPPFPEEGSATKQYTAEEKNACSIEAMRNGGTCEACQ